MATENFGPHLLGGWHHRDYDELDFRLEDYVRADTDLDAALKALTNSVITSKWVKNWAKLITAHVEYIESVLAPPVPGPSGPTGPLPGPSGPTGPGPTGPDPTPTPTPAPSTSKRWNNPLQLDQGDTPHCVGFGWAQWGNCDPVEDAYTNSDGNKIYYECKVIDGEPGQEDGSDVRSGAKAMQNRGKLTAYAFANSLDAVKTFVLTQGPVVCGSDWYNDMFNPDANNFVHPTGGVAGGHCYLMVGYNKDTDVFTFQNSWGPNFADHGFFYMHASDFLKLMTSNGEACAAVELPVQ